MQQVRDAVKSRLSVQTRARIVQTRFAMRRVSAAQRLLPDFLVIGTMRGGTSSLYTYLGYHPCVAPSLRKEVEFFSRHFDRGQAWYRAHFPHAARRAAMARLGRSLLTFEATPYYLFGPQCPQRAAAVVPDAKLIVMLRDPAERAFSHFEHMTRHGLEKLSFEEAIETEPERLADDLQHLRDDPSAVGPALRRFSYLSRGRYAEQLERWLAVYPRDQLLVLESERMFEQPLDVHRQVLLFLGLPQVKPPQFRNYSYVDSRPVRSRLDPGLRRELLARLAEDTGRLAALTGQTFRWAT